jgi:four helix bundle protein
MKYNRFEELPVWKLAADLAAAMFEWTGHSSFRGKGDLSNQIQRAALSISNNIAEGFERGTTNELIAYLYIARGSAGEVRSMLAVMKRMPNLDPLTCEIDRYYAECEQISRQLGGWLQSLQNSDIKGQRHLNEEVQRRFDGEKRRKAFVDSNAERMKEIEAKIMEDVRKRNLAREKEAE